MLNPSYSSLIRILNEDAGADTRITSRYSVVIAAAKRARQIVGGAEHTAFSGSDKAVSIAVNEIQMGSIRIVPGSNGVWDFDPTEPVTQNLPSLIDESYVAAEIPDEADVDGIDDDFDDEDDGDWDDEEADDEGDEDE